MSIDRPGIAQAWFAGDRRDRRSPSSPQAHRGWLVAAAGLIALALANVAGADEAAVPAAAGSFQGLDADVQSLKQEVVDLNRDLFMLEEELLFPANTQVAVFVSMDVGTFFALDSVKILLDGKEVSNYLYTQREAEALLRGGVHRVWLGNLRAGKHEMTAFFTGKGPHERDYQRGATLEIDKGVGAKYVELKISDRARQLQPEFIVKEWE
jgi:hypothetical protein